MKSKELLDALNAQLTHYKVELTDHAVSEVGETNAKGYAVINLVTGIEEHTNTILPGAFFQAQHFDNTLKGLTEPEENVALPDNVLDDVFPTH